MLIFPLSCFNLQNRSGKSGLNLSVNTRVQIIRNRLFAPWYDHADEVTTDFVKASDYNLTSFMVSTYPSAITFTK